MCECIVTFSSPIEIRDFVTLATTRFGIRQGDDERLRPVRGLVRMGCADLQQEAGPVVGYGQLDRIPCQRDGFGAGVGEVVFGNIRTRRAECQIVDEGLFGSLVGTGMEKDAVGGGEAGQGNRVRLRGPLDCDVGQARRGAARNDVEGHDAGIRVAGRRAHGKGGALLDLHSERRGGQCARCVRIPADEKGARDGRLAHVHGIPLLEPEGGKGRRVQLLGFGRCRHGGEGRAPGGG